MTTEFRPQDPERFAEALRRFDEANAADPHQEPAGVGTEPRELVYARWLTEWVLRLRPAASEELRLAARSQHLCRWKLPRETFPMTRAGYLRWREELKKFHAEHAGQILRDVGYSEATIGRVQALNLKRGLPEDAETRVLEDALCLVFLEHQFAQLAAKTPAEKMMGVVQKTWQKMTPEARALAQALPLGESERNLLQKALAAREAATGG